MKSKIQEPQNVNNNDVSKNNLLMDFAVDKTNSTVNIKREFAAPVSDVWAAWTQPELLDKWWAPKPFKSRTKSMDFKVGGHRLYAMVSPEGHEHWGVQQYKEINPKSNYRQLNCFSNDQGVINSEMPQSDWRIEFKKQGDTTLVEITIKHKSLENLEALLKMGFKEGFAVCLNGLDEIL